MILSDITPTDASHHLGHIADWDGAAATKALTLFAKRRTGGGDRLCRSPQELAQKIISRLTRQTTLALLETAFAEEGWENPAGLAGHALTTAGLGKHEGLVRIEAGLALPVVGLGASARCYYGDVGKALGCDTILPEAGGVANAIGAVVGQVAIHAESTITSAGEGSFRVHLPDGPALFGDKDQAIIVLRSALTEQATQQAKATGVEDIRITEVFDQREAQIEAREMFIEATMRITARGRPRIAG